MQTEVFHKYVPFIEDCHRNQFIMVYRGSGVSQGGHYATMEGSRFASLEVLTVN